jgi:hypothetical protein
MPKKHPNKEIQAALNYAKQKGWQIQQGGSHAWGKILCPHNDSKCRCGEFCITSIWSTPKNPINHAKQIRRVVDNCIHQSEEEEI